MANEKFVSTAGLYRIKDKIASATESEQVDPSPEEQPQEDKVNEVNAPVEKKTKIRDRQFDRALQMRHEEYRKLKRDISARYAESIASMTEKLAALNATAEAVESALELITQKQRDIDELQDEWDTENYTSEMAAAMKTLENLRLELIRQNSRLAEKTSGGNSGTSGGSGGSSLLPELSSLSFKQLARMGFMFFSPLLITLLLAAIIIGTAIMMSMRY